MSKVGFCEIPYAVKPVHVEEKGSFNLVRRSVLIEKLHSVQLLGPIFSVPRIIGLDGGLAHENLESALDRERLASRTSHFLRGETFICDITRTDGRRPVRSLVLMSLHFVHPHCRVGCSFVEGPRDK